MRVFKSVEISMEEFMNTVGKQIQAPVTCFLGIVLAALLLGLLSVSPVAAQEDPPSTDATLSSLVVVPGGIADFRSNTYAYSVDVANGTTSVLVTPIANDFSAAISVNGTTVENGSGHSVDDLSVGENTIAIVVTAEDRETANTYTVTVRREPALTLTTTYSQTEVSDGAGEVTVVYGVVTGGEVRPFKDYGFTLFAEQIDATPGQDFEEVTETVSILASEFALNDCSRYEWSQEVSIRIIDDDINEQDETFRIYTQTGLGLIPPFALPLQETITFLDDDEVAAAPEALVAASGNGMVTLTWTAPSDAGTSPVTGYEFQQKVCDGSYGPWLATDHNLGTHHQVSGLTNGTEYTFRVRAVSAAGKGEASTEVTATPQSEFRPVIAGD